MRDVAVSTKLYFRNRWPAACGLSGLVCQPLIHFPLGRVSVLITEFMSLSSPDFLFSTRCVHFIACLKCSLGCSEGISNLIRSKWSPVSLTFSPASSNVLFAHYSLPTLALNLPNLFLPGDQVSLRWFFVSAALRRSSGGRLFVNTGLWL